MTPRPITAIAAVIAIAVLAGCGTNTAKRNATLKRDRQAAIRHAHAGFSLPPCSLLTVAQVSAALGVRAHEQVARAGCVYAGSADGDRRTLTVTPGARPATGQLISASIKHPVTVTGSGYHGQAGSPPVLGDVSVPTTAVAGLVAGSHSVTLLVSDANPNAPSQLHRALTLAHEAGARLAAIAH